MKVNTIVLKKEGSKSISSIPNDLINLLNLNKIKGVLKNKGVGKIILLHTFLLYDTTLELWGWVNGRAGQENKHELPPPIDTILYFGDILCIKRNSDHSIIELTINDYNKLYDHIYGGFESLGTEDTEDTEDSHLENTPRSDYSWKPSDTSDNGEDDIVYSDDDNSSSSYT